MNNRICVYTCIFGDYEQLVDPVEVDGIDYVLFTDDHTLKSDVWNIKYCDIPDGTHPAIFYKRIKCKPQVYLNEYEYCIWIDANFTIINPSAPAYLLHKLQSNNIMVYKHYCLSGHQRDCIKAEVDETVKYHRKYHEEPMTNQIDNYFRLGFPEHYGLFMSGIIVYNNRSEEVRNFCNLWYNEILYNAKNIPQCQLSLPYSLWKSDIKYDINTDCIWNSKLYKITPHKRNY